jgi:uncharacterized membrane protein YgcG
VKRSSTIVLTLVPAFAAACGNSTPALDPCLPQNYAPAACEYAVQNRGYYYGGAWYPHVYTQPFFFYNNAYTGYVARGGRVMPIEAGRYSPSLSGGSATAGRTTTRGGFGSSGAARAFSGGGFSSGG